MITLEALALLVLGLLGGRMASGGFTGDYFNVSKEFMLKWGLTPAGFFVDIIAIFSFLGALWLAHRGWTERQKYHYVLVCGGLMVAALFMFLFIGRISYGSTYGSHDGVIQSEVAAQMLINGVNPYAASFVGTPFEFFHPPRFGQAISPVLSHYAYPPLVILAYVPSALWAQISYWPIDGREMTTLAFIVLVIILLRAGKSLVYKTWMAMFLLVTPLVTLYPLIGFNDIFFLLAIVGSALLARRKHWIVAGALLGLAAVSKQTAFIAWPLWAWWLLQEVRQHHLPKEIAWKSLGWMVGVAILIYLPFIIWNAGALYDDVIHYVSGVVPYTYPIGGDSLYQFSVLLKLVPDAWAPTRPFIGLVIAALISFPIGAFWIRRRPTASQWLTSLVLITFFVSLANRYLYENYVAGLVLLAGVSFGLQWLEKNEDIASKSS